LGEAHLEGADLRKASLRGAYLRGAVLDYSTKCDRETDWGVPAEEADGKWEEAVGVLRIIGQHYRQKGDYDRAHKFYLREMRCHHRAMQEGPSLSQCFRMLMEWVRKVPKFGVRVVSRKGRKGFLLALEWSRRLLFGERKGHGCLRVVGARTVWAVHRWLWNYGAAPARVFGWMVGVVCLWTLLFSAAGVSLGAAEPVTHSWWRALTLSLITFSTLGYGNWHPAQDWAHLLAGIEAIAGVLLSAAFLVSLATKYVHRD